MKNNTLVTALLAAIAGALVFYLFSQYFEITPKNTQQVTENAEQLLETSKADLKDYKKSIDPLKEPQDYMADAKGSPRVNYCKKAYKDLLPSQKTKFDMAGCLLSQNIDLNPEVSPSRDLAVKSKKYDSKLAKCRADFPDSKDLDAFVGCMSDPPKEYGASKSNEPSELSDYHKSQLSEIAGFESSDYESRNLEDICKDTQLIDSVRKNYLMKLKGGDIYRGGLNNKCRWHGEGIYIAANGVEFHGTHIDGNRINGSEYFPDGGIRDGLKFVDGKPHGLATYTFTNGQVNQETYRNGRMISNVMIKASPQTYSQNQSVPRNNAPRPDPWKVIGDEVNKMIERNDNPFYGNKKTAVCNFKSNQGAIISGDCNEINIRVGDTLYWRD